jgi:6,7-dimethyl-8-ribityllumazine synthase
LAARAAAHSHALFIHRTGVLNHVAIINRISLPYLPTTPNASPSSRPAGTRTSSTSAASPSPRRWLGWPASSIDFFELPGAFEIPLHAKVLAKTGKYAGIVGGLVVDGGIYRHDFVAQSVISALMQVQLDTEVPVFSAVLTPHHFHSHSEHHDYFHRISWSRDVKPRRRALPPWPSWRKLRAAEAQRSLNAA